MGSANANSNDARTSVFESIRYANRNLIPAAARPNEVNGDYPFQGYLQLNDGEEYTNQVSVLKMNSAIRRESIKLVKESENDYYFSFKFDSYHDCTVVIYMWWQELRKANNVPLHFVTSPDLPGPRQFKFKKGLGQEFPAKQYMLNTALYKEQDLTEAKDDYFPVVLMIETKYQSRVSEKLKKCCQITYGKLSYSQGEYSFNCIRQKFFLNKLFDLCEIFGIEEGNGENMANDTNKLCVIWFTNDKDTVVLPCRHMCLCNPCSLIVRSQSSKWPICRVSITTCIQIKENNEQKDDETMTKATSALMEDLVVGIAPPKEDADRLQEECKNDADDQKEQLAF